VAEQLQIVKAELYYGAYKSSRREENLALLRYFFGQFASLPFNDQASEIYGRIRAELTARGAPIGPNGLIVAAVAVAHDATLVTHNAREFSRVDGLRFEDWEID
jgi:tRNA(fMet)-specific endonuclease VapC